jgi:capsular exopolysaccharide synthesis family protein
MGLSFLRRNLLTSGAILVTTIGLGMGYLAISPNEYTTSATLAIESSRLQSMPSQPLFNDLPMDLFTVRAAIEAMASPSLIRQGIDELGMWDDAELTERPSALKLRKEAALASITRLLPDNLLQMFTDLQSSSAALKPAGEDGDGPSASPEEVQRTEVLERFNRRLKVTQVPQSLLVTVEYRSSNPKKAERVANGMAQTFLNSQKLEKMQQLRSSTALLEGITERFHGRMVKAQNDLREYQKKLGRVDLTVVGGQSSTISSQSTADLVGRYLATRTERIELEARVKELQDARLQSYNAALAVGSFDSRPLQVLREQRDELNRRMAQLRTTYGNRHPAVVEVASQIRQVDATTESAVNDMIRSKDNDLTVLRRKEETLSRELETSKDLTLEQSAARAEMVELEAQAQAAKGNYETFLAHLKRDTELLELQQADARIVAEATLPLKPSFPRQLPVLALAAIIGLLSSVALAWWRSSGGRSLAFIDEIEDTARSRIIGVLPLLSKRQGDAVVSLWPTQRVRQLAFFGSIEHLRLWLSTTTSSDQRDMKVLVVSSSVSGEGKSTVSSALASQAAATGQRVLLIRGDMRKPGQPRERDSIGLTDVLGGTAELEDGLQLDESSGVYVLPPGRAWHQAIGYLERKNLWALIRKATGTFDLIIIDSPPILATPDAQIYVGVADRMLFLVRWGDTPSHIAARALSNIEQVGGIVSGVCITGVGNRDMKWLVKSSSYRYLNYYVRQNLLRPTLAIGNGS